MKLRLLGLGLILLLAAGCGFEQVQIEDDGQQWILFTQGLKVREVGEALVVGAVEFDRSSGCVYLQRPDATYPVVWPRGTRLDVQEQHLILSDGRSALAEDWVLGGGGYIRDRSIVERCPGEVNDFEEVAVFDSPAEELTIGTCSDLVDDVSLHWCEPAG